MDDEPAMYDALQALSARPALYSAVTTPALWTDPHLSARMLAAHLDPDVDLSSYRLEYLERAVAWLTDRFALGPGLRVADFGCGPGLYANRLARTGASVTGLDLSTRSLDHARARADAEKLPVRYLCQDYLTYEDQDGARYDLIVLIMRDYCALPPDGRRRLLRTVRRHLAEGGHFVLDVDAASAFEAVREQATYAPSLMDGFWSADPYFGFHHTFRYPAARVSLDKFDIVEAGRRRTFCNWVRYFTPAELTAELRAAGLATVATLGDLAGGPYDSEAPHFTAIAAPLS